MNGLTNSAELQYTNEKITEANRACGYSETIRGEALTLAQFAKLSDQLEIIGRDINEE